MRGYGRDFRRGYDHDYGREFGALMGGPTRRSRADSGSAGPPGYDRGFRRRDARHPQPLSGWFPGVAMDGAPMYGWGWWGGIWGWPPYGMIDGRTGYAADWEPRPAEPRESPHYGRAADEALRSWAKRYGYDMDVVIRPRRARRGR